jgi:hypothetical protein
MPQRNSTRNIRLTKKEAANLTVRQARRLGTLLAESLGLRLRCEELERENAALSRQLARYQNNPSSDKS